MWSKPYNCMKKYYDHMKKVSARRAKVKSATHQNYFTFSLQVRLALICVIGSVDIGFGIAVVKTFLQKEKLMKRLVGGQIQLQGK